MGEVQACHPIVIAQVSIVFDFNLANVDVARDKIVLCFIRIIASFGIRVAF